jgi:hypothetical protein
MRERLRTVLQHIVADATCEARWLNTLSLLEFVGARKIGRTMAHHHPTVEVLAHWSDETRHAHAFKRLALDRVASASNNQAQHDYLCANAATAWFQTLDHELAALATRAIGREDSELNYLLTTTLVEQRAMQLYPLYKSVATDPSVRSELGQIIVEEQGHRVHIEEKCRRRLEGAPHSVWADAQSLELQLFERFVSELERELKLSAHGEHDT